MKKSLLFNKIRELDDLLFSVIGPVRILFVVRNILGFANQLPVIMALEKHHPSAKIMLTFDFDGCVNVPETGKLKEYFDKYFISPHKAVWGKWHFVIKTDRSNLYFRRNHTSVYIGHGIGFGCFQINDLDYLTKVAEVDGSHITLFASYAKCKQVFKHISELDQRNDRAFFITGMPKVDSYFNIQESMRNDFLENIGLSKNRKCIVVFSHWTEKALLRNSGLSVIRNLLNLGRKYNIIINGHERLWFEATAGPSAPSYLYKELKSLEKNHDNLRLVTMLEDIKPLLACADLFLTDYSSVFIECCIFDKPILLYKNNDFIFSNKKVGSLYINSSFSFNKSEDVEALCINALQHSNLHKEQRLITVNYFLDQQGNSAKTIADLLLKLGRVCGTSSPRWARVKIMSHQNLLEKGFPHFKFTQGSNY